MQVTAIKSGHYVQVTAIKSGRYSRFHCIINILRLGYFFALISIHLCLLHTITTV